MVMRLEGDRVVIFHPHNKHWRKGVLFGHVFSYNVVKWGVITWIAAVTVIAMVVIRNQQHKQRLEKAT